MSTQILVAEDEEDVARLVGCSLKAAGFKVVNAADGASALARIREQAPALIILDLMLPGMSGLDVCKHLKADPGTSKIPIIMLTARVQEVDRIVGFELGADDYVTKPFSPRELVLRVKARLRRSHGQAEPEDAIRVGDIMLDRKRHSVEVKGKAIGLTATEFKLLAMLMERCGRVQSRDKMLADVWGYESAIDTRTVDIHIRRLREKLGKAASQIETVRGFGYRMAETKT
jgi:phosphate regulon transcriptional regulator PhoB